MAVEHSDSRDLRIGLVLDEYLTRQQRGEPACEEELLAAHPDLAEDLRAHFEMFRQVTPSLSFGQAENSTAALPADALPGYDIQNEIHRGGQGVVYEALQKATRRKVAIKVMREGPFAGWRDRARFEREVQVLGALKHPSIVTIHDSGTAAGCYFFVMDYIEGKPLDLWLAEQPRSIDAILELFLSICEAVNAAHIKGIIHRDLKPGNIRIDEENKPHVLDFGLAKVAAHEQNEHESRDMTEVGQFVGSLPWTSPEQAQGMLDQIDTRTDVYALGIVLYQMLTNRFPYDVGGPVRDVLNRIVTTEVVRPSVHRPAIKTDVDAIVLKCLRKEPHRRYQTAGELGRDIERYLRGEAISARSDSGLYVFGKLLRRHRMPVAVASAFTILITVSLLASVSLWRQAVAERDRADVLRVRADATAADAQQARQVAEAERVYAQDQAERLRRTSYLNRIALAQGALDRKYLSQARTILDACPADLRGWEWRYLMQLSSRSTLMDVAADPNCVTTIAITPDGKRIATSGCDGLIKLWDSQKGTQLSQLVGHVGQVNAITISSDGQFLASAGRDRTLRVWDLNTGSNRILEQDRQYIHGLSFSPDARVLAAGGQNRTLVFWNVATGELMRSAAAQAAEISCVAYSPDGKLVACGEFVNLYSANSMIRLWDAETGQLVRELVGHSAGVLSIAFSPDSTIIGLGSSIPATGTDALGTLKLLDVATGEEILSLRGHEGFVDSVAFSPDGKMLASAGSPRMPALGMEADHTMKVWDATTGAELRTYSAHSGGGRSVAWSKDGSRVFSGGMDGRLKAWPSTAQPEASVLRGHAGSVLRLAFSPDGKRVASSGGQSESELPPNGSLDASLRVWDLQTHSEVLLLAGHENAVFGLAWSPDGKYIASGGKDKTVRLWDSRTGTSVRVLTNQEDIVQCVAFSPDSKLLAAVAGKSVTVWEPAGGAERQKLRDIDTLRSVAFSPDGRLLATGSQTGNLRILDVLSGKEHRTIATGSDLNGAWFSPDSRTVATAHANGTILLWDVAEGTQVAAMTGPQRSVQWIDFSPDGRRIAAGTTDMMLKIWDVESATEVYAIRAHNAPVTCVKFSPDGNDIATCGQDSLIKIWETAPQATSSEAVSSRPEE